MAVEFSESFSLELSTNDEDVFLKTTKQHIEITDDDCKLNYNVPITSHMTCMQLASYLSSNNSLVTEICSQLWQTAIAL